LASVLDQPPFEQISAAEVQAADTSLSARLLAAWLSISLDIGVTFTPVPDRPGVGSIQCVTLTRSSGDIVLERTDPGMARLVQPGQPTHEISLVRRNLRDCLAEELRHLDPDEVYGKVLSDGMGLIVENS
jgi:glucose-6-phosphate dehydrogenase assembly protein OpcA